MKPVLLAVVILYVLVVHDLRSIQLRITRDYYRFFGVDTNIAKFPYVVSIVAKLEQEKKKDEQWCIGTIIHERWVITAAFCIKNEIFEEFTKHKLMVVRGNTSFYDGTDRHKIDHTIIQSITHKKYEGHILEYDLGLIKVKEAFKGRHEEKITFSTKKTVVHKGEVISPGWREVGLNESRESDHLQYIEMNVLDENGCGKYMLTTTIEIPSKIICAKSAKGNVCRGDTGGPLIFKKVLVGVTSFLLKCSELYPMFYTSVGYYSDWIKSVIEDEQREWW